jgi:hypothetical protein
MKLYGVTPRNPQAGQKSSNSSDCHARSRGCHAESAVKAWCKRIYRRQCSLDGAIAASTQIPTKSSIYY